MKGILNNFKSKWILVLLCISCSVGVQAQWGEQWQDFEDAVFAEGTGNSYWVFDDNGNAYAANNSAQDFQYTIFTSEGEFLDYSFVDPHEVSTVLSGLNEEQFNYFFSNSERVLSEVSVGTGQNFDDDQFVSDVVQVYLEALDKYGLEAKPYYGSSGEYGWNDGSAELFWSEYMPITSSFARFYNGLQTGDRSDMALGAGLLLLDIVSLGEGQAGLGTIKLGLDELGMFGARISNIGEKLANFSIPKYYTYASDGGDIFVTPNAFKHLEELVVNGERLGPEYLELVGQTYQKALHSAIDNIISTEVIEYGKMYYSGGHEIIFSAPRAAGELPAISHFR
jgi:hypothetical protein